MNSLPGAFPGKMRRVTSTAVGVTLAALMVGSGALPASAGQSNRVKSWGANSFGQLGDATLTERSTPVTVAGMTGADVTQVSASGDHSLALLSNGTVEAWGDNFSGQLGDGTSGRNADHSTPGTVKDLRNVRAVAAGGSHNLALRNDGTVWAWGRNDFGQLGNGESGTRSFTPVAVLGLKDVSLIAAGRFHSLAYPRRGPVTTWGLNDHGQLGDGSTTARTVPKGIPTGRGGIVSIAGGDSHSLIV
jgi:alpha-tubulin suppressor-like RCC1 family protein